MAKTTAQKKAAAKRKERVYVDAEQAMQDAPVARGIQYMRLPSGVKSFRPKMGTTYEDTDILPFEQTEKSFRFKKAVGKVGSWAPRRTVHVHFDVGPDKQVVLCPAMNFGDPCPICEYRNALQANNPKIDWKGVIKPLLPKDRQIYVLRTPTFNGGVPAVYEDAYFNFGQQLDDKIAGASEKRRQQYQQYWRPDVGSTLRVVAQEKKMDSGRTFPWCQVNEIDKRDEPLPEEVVNHGIKIDDCFIIKTYEEIKKAFHGTGTKAVGANGKAGKPAADEVTDTDASGNDAEAGDEESEGVWKKGDKCTYTYKNKDRSGVIKSINAETEVASIKEDGTGELRAMDLDDLYEPADEEEEDEDEEEGEAAEADEEEGEDADEEESEDEDEDEEEEDEDEDEEEEDALTDDPEDEDEEESEDEDEDTDEDEEEEDEDEEEEDEDEDAEDVKTPPKKSTKKPPKKAAPAAKPKGKKK